MSTRIVDYLIAEGSTAHQLRGTVEDFIEKGYEPFGSLVVTPLYERNYENAGQTFTTYAQAMVIRVNDG